jgi:hypothetical protein
MVGQFARPEDRTVIIANWRIYVLQLLKISQVSSEFKDNKAIAFSTTLNDRFVARSDRVNQNRYIFG